MTHVNPILNQTDFRFRVDSGNEATATWLAAININISIDVDTDFRYRVVVAETAGSTNPATVNLLLEFSLNSGAFAAVTGSSACQFATFTGSSDTDATTQQLGSGTFVAGELDNTGAVTDLDLQSSETEMEYCLTIDSGQVSNDDTIDLRVVDGGADLNTYGNTGRATAIEVSDTLLVIQEASHLHAADNLDIHVDLAIDEASHLHSADNLIIVRDVEVLNFQNSDTPTGGTTETISSYVVPAGDDKVLIVFTGNEFDGTSNNADSVTHNGVNLTFEILGEFDGTWLNTCEAWYLFLGSTTPTGDIVATWPSTNRVTTLTARTVTGLAQQAPEASDGSGIQATDVTTTLTTLTPNAFIADGVIYGENNSIAISQGPDQVEDFAANFAGNTAAYGASHEMATSAQSYTLGWTAVSQRWGEATMAFANVNEGVVTLIIADADHAHTADNLAMNTDLTVAEALHAHAADNLAMDTGLTVAEALHGHTADNLDIGIDLNIAEALHGHSADNLAMNTDLIIAETNHAHTADNVIIEAGITLVIQESSHAHTADNIDIHVDLSINDALHTHTADNVVIEAGTLLVIQDADHAHSADNLDIHVDLAIDDTDHAHAADNLAMGTDLSIQEALHAHAAENLNIAVDLFINETLHGHTADNITIGLGLISLDINDASHAHFADNLDIILPANIVQVDGLLKSASINGTIKATNTNGVIKAPSTIGLIK